MRGMIAGTGQGGNNKDRAERGWIGQGEREEVDGEGEDG